MHRPAGGEVDVASVGRQVGAFEHQGVDLRVPRAQGLHGGQHVLACNVGVELEGLPHLLEEFPLPASVSVRVLPLVNEVKNALARAEV